MRFSTPVALLLLVLIPYFVWLGWPRIPYRRRRDIISLVLRVVIILMLILGLAGLQTVQAADKLAVVFLIDSSDSVDAAARSQAEAYVRDTLSRMTPDDQAGIVVFGKNALVERPVSNVKEFTGITSTPIRLETDIAGAIRLGLAMFPPDVARRLVILSDGVETQNSAIEAARLAAATNVQIDFVPLQRQSGPEMQVSDVRLPTTVNQGEVFDLGVTIDSTYATKANITVLSGGVVVKTETKDIQVGTNNFVLTGLKVPAQGFIDFQVRVDPLGGQKEIFYQNKEMSAFTEVTGPPRILVIASKPEETAALLPALQQVGLTVDVRQPTDLPIGLAPLAVYKAVVLVDVSATELNETRMKVLQTYVRDLGGGLVVIGGPDSYGVGGYYQTPLEETLPVEVRIKDQKRIPSLTMVYVVDRSGSMEIIGPSGVTNLELSKEAARRSINFLYERDRAGVLSFDSNPQWLVPIDFVKSRERMMQLLGSLRPGGGTDIYAAIQEIAKTLPSDPSTLKHVILLTDGGAEPGGIVATVQSLRQKYGITFTSIGIGNDVPSFMRDIASVGGGNYYNLVDLSTIPQIFAAETVLATRSYIVEDEFTPNLAGNSQIMQGVTSLPTLKGYVATTAKPTSTVILTSPVQGYNDPILASWQYGLGRVVAWTSDATTRWSVNWTKWDGFQRFWSQVIRSSIVQGLDNTLEARVEQRAGKSVLVVEARDKQGAFINSLSLDASVIDPRLGAQKVTLRQVAPGRYEAEFTPDKQGAYFIQIAGAGDGQAVMQRTGWVLTYSPEYRIQKTDTALLNDIANLTGGSSVLDTPDRVFRHDIREETASTALWPLMLLVAVMVLPFDIAVRRVVVTRTDMLKLRAWARKKLGIQDRKKQALVTSARMAALKGAKVRATGTVPAVDEQAAEGSASAAVPAMQSKPAAPLSKSTPVKVDPGAGRVLAAKLAEKRRQQRDGDDPQ